MWDSYFLVMNGIYYYSYAYHKAERGVYMGMPQIPEGIHRPTLDQTIIDLLESVALEHLAVAHIINAEGEKTQAIVQQYSLNNIDCSQLESNCRTNQNLMNTLMMKEWLMITKLNTILELRASHKMESCQSESNECEDKYKPCVNGDKIETCEAEKKINRDDYAYNQPVCKSAPKTDCQCNQNSIHSYYKSVAF